jgi:AraC-like DNA-binding protein
MPNHAAPAAEKAWSPLDFDQEAFRAGAREKSFKRFARQGVRTLHAHEGGSGTSDTVRLDEDLLLTVINCVLPCTTRWRYDTDEALIMLRASLCCDVAFEVGSSTQLVFNRPEVTLVCLPKGRPQAVDIAGSARQQGLVAIFRASAFAARYGLQLGDLPPLVRDAVTGTAEVGRIASFPLDHRLAALLADTIDTRLEGELRVLQYAGRLAELVAYTLDAMQHVPLLRGNALNRQRDVELAHAALARLGHSFRKPPLFAELAREIGTNQNKLKTVFKEAFGVTMAEYCLERRVREAQQLLLAANLTIAQVAERVGYEHQSSFAAAFSGHVGMSPREYRQHRAPFNLSLNAGGEGDPVRA